MRLEILNTFITAVTDEDDEDLAEEGAARFAAYVVIAHPLLSNTRIEFLCSQELSLHETVRRRWPRKHRMQLLQRPLMRLMKLFLWSLPRRWKRNGAYKEGNQSRSAPL